jgi:hypothetical protein
MEMNLLESWRVISDCIVAPAGELAFAGVASDVHRPVGRWHALFSDRSRPLLLPINNRQARGNSLRFFLPELWRKCYASVRLHVHDLCGVRAHLPVMTLPATAAPTLTDQLAFTESPQLAFLIGTPGPYQKASILVMTMQGEPLALTKLALGPRANSMVQGEAAWLRKLSTQSALRAQVPQLLREGVTRNGHHYLAQSVVTGRPCSRTFSPAHAEFLRRLGAMDTRISRSRVGNCWRTRFWIARAS